MKYCIIENFKLIKLFEYFNLIFLAKLSKNSLQDILHFLAHFEMKYKISHMLFIF